eukprot:m.225217 g.225217  ORF g.225217 m.225217 type:complete len:619 (+) comp15955_c0_seq5:77-1933(+)
MWLKPMSVFIWMLAVVSSFNVDTANIEQGPFLGLAYNPVNASAQHNIHVMATINQEDYAGKLDKHKGWIPGNITAATSKLLNETQNMPEGLRAIRALNLYSNESIDLRDNILPPDANCSGKWPDTLTFNGVWWEHGSAQVAALHNLALSAFKNAGGEVDIWAVDDEQAGTMHSWWIAKGPDDMCGRAKWTAIQNDSRFPKLLQLLQGLGFGSPNMSSPYWLHEYMTCCGEDLNLRHNRAWNAAANQYFYHWINIGQVQPVLSLFPNVLFSEYDASFDSAKYCVPDSGGFPGCNVTTPPSSSTPSGNGMAIPGSIQSPAIYLDMQQGFSQWVEKTQNVKSYPLTAFNAAKWGVNKLRSIVLSTPNTTSENGRKYSVAAYISYKSYKSSLANNSDYYQEMLIHTALAGSTRFLMWNTHAVLDDNPVVSRTLDELNNIVTPAQRIWQDQELLGWDLGYMMTHVLVSNTSTHGGSGMKCFWRFSPDLTGEATKTPQSFVTSKPSDSFVSISIPNPDGTNVNITISKCRVVLSASNVSRNGMWIVQSIDVLRDASVKQLLVWIPIHTEGTCFGNHPQQYTCEGHSCVLQSHCKTHKLSYCLHTQSDVTSFLDNFLYSRPNKLA